MFKTKFSPHLNAYEVASLKRAHAVWVSAVIFAITVHSTWLVLFALAGVSTLAYFNIASVAIFIFNLYLLAKNRVMAVYLLSYAEVLAHAVVASYLLPWQSGFHFYIITMSIFSFLAPTKNLWIKVASSAFPCLVYLFIYALFDHHGHSPEMAPGYLTFFTYANIVGAFFVFAVIAFDFWQSALKSERALQKEFSEVTRLKQQQDADYFLTSLLTSRLHRNTATSRVAQVETLIRQKKTFEFKAKQHDIGGDLCISDEITLNGQLYTVVFNGDAMGKSLQGAGGALIAGSVFTAIVERTRLDARLQSQPATTWLKNAFNELHQVIVNFDATMLISGVIGILEQATGNFFWINAEHPYVVLIRDNKPQFIENSEYIYRKIGTPGIDEKVKLKRITLKPNDTLVIASDGRDDIAVSETKFNADETLFLRVVKSAWDSRTGHTKPFTEQITRVLEEHGSIIDDISLMTVKYQGEA